MIGFFGAHRLRKSTIAAFSFLKALSLVLFLLFCIDIVMYVLCINDHRFNDMSHRSWVRCGNCNSEDGEVPVLGILMVVLLIYQVFIFCYYVNFIFLT